MVMQFSSGGRSTLSSVVEYAVRYPSDRIEFDLLSCICFALSFRSHAVGVHTVVGRVLQRMCFVFHVGYIWFASAAVATYDLWLYMLCAILQIAGLRPAHL